MKVLKFFRRLVRWLRCDYVEDLAELRLTAMWSMDYYFEQTREEIRRVKRGKMEVIEAIKEMGVEVPDGVLLNDLPQYIRKIGKGAE